MSNVRHFPARSKMTVEECLRSALNQEDEIEEVIVIFTAKDGTLGFRTSGVSCASALWQIEHAKLHVMGQLD